MERHEIIRDLIYFDADKTASIVSQLEGGLPRETKIGAEATSGTGGELGIGFGPLRAGVSGRGDKTTSILESRTMHHDLLDRLEQGLFQRGVAIDLNDAAELKQDLAPDDLRSIIDGASYIRAEGWAAIDDYRQVEAMLNSLNRLMSFVAMTQEGSYTQHPELANISNRLENARRQAQMHTDPKAKARVDKLDAERTAKIFELSGVTKLPEWQVDGISLFIDTLMPNRIRFRVTPLESVAAFQVAANLKRECFVDSDLENLLHAYSARPTFKLTMLGLVSDLPPSGQQPSDVEAMSRQDALALDLGSIGVLDRAFDPILQSLAELRQLTRLCAYPSIAVYPLAAYRTIRMGGVEVS